MIEIIMGCFSVAAKWLIVEIAIVARLVVVYALLDTLFQQEEIASIVVELEVIMIPNIIFANNVFCIVINVFQVLIAMFAVMVFTSI